MPSNLNRNDMPIGFTMSLSMDMDAMSSFASLNKEEQKHIVDYIKDPSQGPEPKEKIDQVVQKLHDSAF